jgi:hypothetical protein
VDEIEVDRLRSRAALPLAIALISRSERAKIFFNKE